MRAILKISPAALAGLLLLLAACGGGDDDAEGGVSDQPDGANPGSELFVSDARGALRQSAQSFAQEVQSLSADFSFSMSTSEFDMEATGDFAYEAPDRLHMAMEITGLSGEAFESEVPFNLNGFKFEMLTGGDKIYMKIPFFGSDDEWFVMSLDDLGTDAASFRDLLNTHSPFDYGALLEKIGGEVENLGEEDGLQHVRFTVNMQDVMAAFSDSLSSSDTAADELFSEFSGPLIMDMWVDPDTLLPERFSAHGEFDIGADVARFAMEVAFSDYNESVDIPDAPTDARSFSEMLGFDFGAETLPEGSEVFMDFDGDGVNDLE